MVKLVDTRDLKSRARKGVPVRFRLGAPLDYRVALPLNFPRQGDRRRARVYPLEEALQAFGHLARGPFGNVVIRVAP